MIASSPRTLLFDLDGTLVDPARGIIGAYRHALARLGAPDPGFDALRFVIGPPLRESFPRFVPADQVEATVLAYREAYGGGMLFEATPYEGVRALLATLAARGHRLIVCTSKPRPFALQVLERFDLLAIFEAVYGAELDGRFDDKAELMAHLLATSKVEAARAVMIGDRKFDIRAAKANGVASIGALWGYGSEAELRAAGADALCARPAELIGTIDAL